LTALSTAGKTKGARILGGRRSPEEAHLPTGLVMRGVRGPGHDARHGGVGGDAEDVPLARLQPDVLRLDHGGFERAEEEAGHLVADVGEGARRVVEVAGDGAGCGVDVGPVEAWPAGWEEGVAREQVAAVCWVRAGRGRVAGRVGGGWGVVVGGG